jgi:hypothetical protein
VVLGRVGVAQQLGEVARVARIDADADRSADVERASFDSERPRQHPRMRCATPAASSVFLMLWIKTKSSPPRRASVSLGSRLSRRAPTSRSSVSPAWWPKRLVHQLETVDVDEEQRELRAAACRLEDRLRAAVGEQHAVGQPGERVARREVLGARLGLAARRDVRRGAAVARRTRPRDRAPARALTDCQITPRERVTTRCTSSRKACPSGGVLASHSSTARSSPSGMNSCALRPEELLGT